MLQLHQAATAVPDMHKVANISLIQDVDAANKQFWEWKRGSNINATIYFTKTGAAALNFKA